MHLPDGVAAQGHGDFISLHPGGGLLPGLGQVGEGGGADRGGKAQGGFAVPARGLIAPDEEAAFGGLYGGDGGGAGEDCEF